MDKDKKEFIKNNYDKLSVEEMAIAVGYSESYIYIIMRELGVGKRFKWTDEKIEILRQIYPTRNYELLFEKLGYYSLDGIRSKASELKITVDDYYVSEDDVNFIMDNYQTMKYSDIAIAINKPISYVYTKISESKCCKFKRWTEEDLKLLKEVYPYYHNAYLKEIFFPERSVETIRTMALKNNIHKEKFCFGVSDHYSTSVKCLSKNNDNCDSFSERIITNFFIDFNIEYAKSVLYSNYCKIGICGKRSVDWVLEDGTFVEFFGLAHKDKYKEKLEYKINLCKINNIKLIELYHGDLKNLHDIFKSYIKN